MVRVKAAVVLAIATLVIVPAGATPLGPVKVNAETEGLYNHIFPSVVEDPLRPGTLVAVDVKRIQRGSREYTGTCVVYLSTNYGETWTTAGALPMPSSTDCRRVPPPELAASRSGIYAAYWAAPRVTMQGRVVVTRLTVREDGTGVQFGPPVLVPLSPHERAALAARIQVVIPRTIAVAADPETDDVYVGWASMLLWVSRSGNRGASFSDPTVVALPPTALAEYFYGSSYAIALDVSPGGHVYLAGTYASCTWVEARAIGCWHYALVFSVSHDRGQTFSIPVQLTHITDYDTEATGALARPSLVVDRNDPRYIYIAYDDAYEGTLNYRALMMRSTDGGATWVAPAVLSDDASGAAVPEERPQLAVDGEGRLHAAWYDGRNDITSVEPCDYFTDGRPPPCTAGRDVYYTVSTDHGATFAENRRVTPPPEDGAGSAFNAATRVIMKPNREGPTERRSVDAALGSIGMVPTARGVVLVWEHARWVTIGPGTWSNWDLMAARL